jgi:hypothetical protein
VEGRLSNQPDPQTPGQSAEARMAALILQLTDEVARAKMETFLHFAQDPSKIALRLEPSREDGLRLVLTYPFARDCARP